MDWSPEYKRGKHAFMGIFPSTFNRQQLANMDENGVALPGTVLKKGDPIILAARSTEGGKKKGKRRLFSDASLVWDHHDDGYVTDAYDSEKGTAVLTSMVSPLREGDKLCYDEETQLLTKEGWKPIPEITKDDLVACMVNDGIGWSRPTEIHRYETGGRMYRATGKALDIFVTDNHRLYARFSDEEHFSLKLPSEVFGKEVYHCDPTLSEYLTVQHEEFIENYDRPVYCVTVPGHILYVRRNGLNYWCGNSNRFGNKGVVRIIPDDEMPMTEDGMVAELAFAPGSTVGRGNPVQVAELALGKIAAATGKIYRVSDFDDIEDIPEFVDQELQKYGIDPGSPIIDRKTGRKIVNGDGTGIPNGYMWIMKLHHTSESKGSARGLGGYDANDAPSKGGADGAKRMAPMHLNALIAHGAPNVFMDAKYNRGQANPDFWIEYMQGRTPTMKKTPLVYQKFENSLRASGINVKPDEGRLNILAMTDADVNHLSGGREVKSGETLRWEKDKAPISGGLFDPAVFGMNGDRWGQMTPAVPILNPVMEEPARILLGLKQKELKAVMSGEQDYGNYGTGFPAIQKALSEISVPLAMNNYRAKIQNGRAGERDQAVRALGYLKACEQTGLTPKDWMLSSIPILPPKFRPVSEMQGNVPLVDDANYLYKLMIDTNNGLKDLRKITRKTHGEEYGLYDAYKQVTGLADPTHPKLVQRQVRRKMVISRIWRGSTRLI